YLTHKEERTRIAEAGRQVVVAEHTPAQHVHAIFALFAENLTERYRLITVFPAAERALRRATQMLASAKEIVPGPILAQLTEAERTGAEPGRLLELSAALYGCIARSLDGSERVR